MKNLKLDNRNSLLFGVCSGLANYLSINVTIVRLIFVLGGFFYGIFLIAYLILWMCML
jgi:phage shock protein C